MHPLDGPRAKLDRAAEHIQEFDAAVRRWNNSKTFRTVSEQFNSDKTEYIYRFEFGSIPVRIGIIAGDALHNLRSSLDYLVWQLALLTTGHPGTETAFPICLTDGEASQKRIKTLLKHVPNDAREIIKDLQPYNTRDELKPELHILWLLHRLSIIDKHQFVTVAGAQWTIDCKKGMGYRWLNEATVEIAIPVVDENLPPAPPKVTYNLVLGHKLIPGIRPDVLPRIHHDIKEIVLPRFESFFPK